MAGTEQALIKWDIWLLLLGASGCWGSDKGHEKPGRMKGPAMFHRWQQSSAVNTWRLYFLKTRLVYYSFLPLTLSCCHLLSRRFCQSFLSVVHALKTVDCLHYLCTASLSLMVTLAEELVPGVKTHVRTFWYVQLIFVQVYWIRNSRAHINSINEGSLCSNDRRDMLHSSFG